MTKLEEETISYIVSDFLTGNHLLGRERSALHKNMMNEASAIFSKTDNGVQDLSEREVDILKCMADAFYGGLEDMCDQLGLNIDNIKKYF